MNILKWIWQLPQHLLALILIAIWKAEKVGSIWRIKKQGIGISLGNYIILDNGYSDIDIKHEQGHQVQSMYFGPLYLIVIGFASAVCNNLWDRLFHKNWNWKERHRWYYSRFPEAWSDRLGGVVRDYLR